MKFRGDLHSSMHNIETKRNLCLDLHSRSPLTSLSAIPDCGGYLHTLEGSFTSPNYPRPHPELAYCVWHIQVEKGYKIKLNFKEIL